MLRATGLQGELKFDNVKLLIFSLYSVETQRHRKSFDHVRAMLLEKGVKYSMLFPTMLHVQDGDRVQFFTSPREAAAWADTIH